MMQTRIIRNVRLGIKSLLLHKLRSLLTMLGVVFGVGSVVAMLSVGEGASERAMAQIEKLGSKNIIISSMEPEEERETSQAARRGPTMNIYGLTYADELRIRECLPSVVRTVPAKIIPKGARLGEMALDVRVVGTTPAWFDLVKRDLVAGRVLSEIDLRSHAGVCVLSEAAARKLLATEHTVGQSIRIWGQNFTVVGIVKTDDSEGAVQTPDRSSDAYIPLTTAQERFGDIFSERTASGFRREQVELHQIIVEVNELENVIGAGKAVEAMLKRFHKKPDYRISVPLELLRQAQETARIFSIVLASIAGISLLVGGIGIMNIMLASVTERTREIGVRRAIGAQRRQIIVQFLIETVVLSTIGGLIGVGVGLGIPLIIETFANMPTKVTAWSVVLSLSISAMVGIIFGLYPAIRAANLDPIVALRHE